MPLYLPTFLAILRTMWHLSRMHIRGILAAIALLTLAAPAMAQFSPGFHALPRQSGEIPLVRDISSDGTVICGVFATHGVLTGYTYSSSGFDYYTAPQLESRGVSINSVANNGDAFAATIYTTLPDGNTYGQYRGTDGVDHFLVAPGAQSGITLGRISADGSVAVGTQDFLTNVGATSTQAVVYTASSGMQVLPSIPDYGFTYTTPTGLSADGRVVCGGAQQFLFNDRVAWTWTQEGGYQILPDAPGAADTFYEATAANDDGSIIVGRGTTGGLRWINGQAEQLEAAPGFRYGYPIDVSGDGSIITGVMRTIDTNHPVHGIWTEETGWVTFAAYLQSHGVDIPAGFTFNSDSLFVSSDGLTFAGTGAEAFVVRIPSPPAGLFVAALLFPATRRRRL